LNSVYPLSSYLMRTDGRNSCNSRSVGLRLQTNLQFVMNTVSRKMSEMTETDSRYLFVMGLQSLSFWNMTTTSSLIAISLWHRLILHPTAYQTTVYVHICLPFPTIRFAVRLVIWILIPNKLVVYRFSYKSPNKVHFTDVFYHFWITTNLT